MAAKKNNRVNNATFDKLHMLLFAVVFAGIGVLALTNSFAIGGSKTVTGTLGIVNPSEFLRYGDSITFEASTKGRLALNSTVYVTTVCLQADTVVYQWSKWGKDLTFPLIDQSGDGLDWNGKAASCEAWLIYNVEKGKGSVITTLAIVNFNVLAK